MFKYFEFIKHNHNILQGDIFEFGIYKGKSLFPTALLLKYLNSNKKIYAFDSYCGFKTFVDPKDDISNFYTMYKNGFVPVEQVIYNLYTCVFYTFVHLKRLLF